MVLITAIGPDVHTTLRDLRSPLLPQKKTYKDLGEIFKTHFSQNISFYKERKQFYQLRQTATETIRQWYAVIKKGSNINCKCEGELEGRIRDQFITGMKEGKIWDRLFKESHMASLSGIKDFKREATLSSIVSSNKASEVNKVTTHYKSKASSNF